MAVVGAQICPSSSPSVICRGLECIDRSQSLPQRPWSVPFQAGLDLSLGRVGASSGRVRSQWRLSAPRLFHHHRHRSYAWARSAQIGPRAFRKGHKAYLPRQAWISHLEGWSQLWACEEPVAVVGAQICPSSSPSVICRGLECIDRSQSLPQRPWSVPLKAGLDFSLGGLEPAMGL